MKRMVLSAWCVLAGLAAGAKADLGGDIQRVLADRLLARAKVGIAIIQLEPDARQDRVLYAHNERLGLIPASNMKLLTSSAALDAWGPDFRFRTLLVQSGRDLVLIGDGDPSFGDAELLKKHGWGVTTVFANWAEQLKKAGLSGFDRVLVDDSVFDEVLFHPNWPADQQQSPYAAQVAGMSLNGNCIGFHVRSSGTGRPVSFTTDPPTRYVSVRNTCVGGARSAVWLTRQPGGNQIILRGTCRAPGQGPVSVTIHDPALYAATVLAETLRGAGIEVRGEVARDRGVRARLARREAGPALTLLAIHETPLGIVLARANKDSVNLYSESLCKRLGYAASGQSGSWSTGTAAVAAFLRKLGAADGEFELDDGCGLSRKNAVSPRTIVEVLRHNFHAPHRSQYLETLAVGGEDGTLDNRFREPELRGKVLAKTGYIAGVSALSGYCQVRERWFAFSILMNELPAGSNSTAKQLQDRIVRAIAAHGGGR